MTNSKYTKKEYTIAESAYLAGLMDGEGTFFIGNYGKNDKATGNGHFQTVLKVTTTDKCIAEWLFHSFGGWHNEYTPAQRAKNCKGPVYSWSCSGDRLTHLCEIMLPYLIAKRDQALVLLEMRKTYTNKEYVKGKQGVQPVPEHIQTRRLDLMKQLKALHCRNYSR